MAAPLDAVSTNSTPSSCGRALSLGPAQPRPGRAGMAADLRLFLMTYAAGFLFVSIILG